MRRLGGVPQTRMHLLGRVHRLERVQRAAALLRKKREALVIEFFRQARPVADARVAIAGRARAAYDSLVPAFALHGEHGLRAMAWPLRDPPIEIRPRQVGGIATPEIGEWASTRRSLGARGTDPGLTGPAAASTASEFEELVSLLLESASREVVIRRLAAELARTSRQVNVLERRLVPSLQDEISYLQASLDEREREEQLRLRQLQAKKNRSLDDRSGDPLRWAVRPGRRPG